MIVFVVALLVAALLAVAGCVIYFAYLATLLVIGAVADTVRWIVDHQPPATRERQAPMSHVHRLPRPFDQEHS